MEAALAKEISLTSAALVFSAVLWWLLAWLLVGQAISPLIVVLAVLVGLLWLLSLALALAFVQHTGLSSLLITIIPLLLILIGRFSLGAIASALIIIALLTLARHQAQSELKNRRRFNTVPVFAPVTRYLLFALLIALAGLSIATLTTHFSSTAITIPPEIIQPYVANVTRSLTPGIPISVGEITVLATNIVNEQLTSLSQANPLLTALAALIALLLLSRLVISLVNWPSLALLAAAIYLARRWRLLRWQAETITIKKLTL